MTLAVDMSGVAHAQAQSEATTVSSTPRGLNLLTANGGWLNEKFRLLEKLGEGGFGVVFKAEQVQPIQRIVAVKILKAGADTEKVIARFDTERQSLALMEHPNIARVLDAGQTSGGQPYFVMELVRGRSITSYCSRHECTLRQRIELFIAVCAAVHHAHQKGIIHRDLKPSNVLVMEDEGAAVPKVIDFGIAKVLENKNDRQTLDTGMDQLVGTPGYISPEQIEHGSSRVDTRSDVYALGSILMELLTGSGLVTPMDMAQKPLHQILRDQAERDPPRPSSREPALKGDLDWIILKALEREPNRRYGSAEELAADLRRYLSHQPVTARPPSRRYLLGKFVRRHRVGVSASAAIALAVLAGGITSTALYVEAERNRKQATQSREDLRRSYSRSDEQMARQLTERTDYNEAVAWLCRALRTDPGNQLAAINLLTLLQHVHLLHPTTPALPLPDGVPAARLVGLSREADRVIAISPPPGSTASEIASIWDLQTQRRRDLLLPKGIIATCLEMSPDGRRAFLAADNGQVEVWSLPTEQRQLLKPALPASVLRLAISGDGQMLAAGAEDGTVQVWNLASPDSPPMVLKQTQLGEERHFIDSLALDFLGTAVAASFTVPARPPNTHVSGLATVWDLTTGEPFGAPIEVDDSITTLALHRERELLAVGMPNGTVHVGNYRTEQEVVPALVHPAAVTSLAINGSGSTLTVGDGRGYLHTWDLRTGQPLVPAQAHDGEIVTAMHAQDQGLVVTVSRHGELQVWNPSTGRRVRHRLQHSVAAVDVTADGSMLALAAHGSPTVHVWSINERMATRRFVAGPEEHLAPVCELPVNTPEGLRDAQLLASAPAVGLAAAADGDGSVYIFDTRTGQPAGPPLRHPPAVGAIALSADGRIAVTSGRDQLVRVWDIASGRWNGISLPHSSFVSALALSPDGKRLLTVTDEGEIRVWETSTGSGLTPAIRQGPGISDVVISDDGQQFIYRTKGEGWFSLPMPPEAAYLPDWFLGLAEALARQRLSAEGKTEALTPADVERTLSSLPTRAAEKETAALRWAQWLTTTPQERPLSPADGQPFRQYVESLEKNPTPFAITEAMRYRSLDVSSRTGG